MMINITKIIIISAICGLGLFYPSQSTIADLNTSTARVKPTNITLTGTMYKLAVEGTCYQLAADNGKRYELIGKFPKIYDRKVRVSGSIDLDVSTICQVGQPFRVKTIRAAARSEK